MDDESQFGKIDFSDLLKKFKDKPIEKKYTPFGRDLTPFDFSYGHRLVEPSGNQQAISRVDVERLPGYDRLDVLQKFGARVSARAIQLAVGMGYVNPDRMGRIIDFGAGSGGPTFALVGLGNAVGSRVEAVENNQQSAQKIIDSAILPEDQVHITDGLAYLGSAQSKDESFDLVTAFMLGPDMEGSLFRRLAKASSTTLSGDGKLLITSDFGTLSTVKAISEQSGAKYNFVHGVSQGDEIVVPNTLVLSRDSCKLISSR